MHLQISNILTKYTLNPIHSYEMTCTIQHGFSSTLYNLNECDLQFTHPFHSCSQLNLVILNFGEYAQKKKKKFYK